MWNAGPGLHFNDFSILKNIVFFFFSSSFLALESQMMRSNEYIYRSLNDFRKKQWCVRGIKTDIMDFVDFSGGNQFIYAYQRPPWPLTGRSGTRGGIVGTVRLENNRKKGRKMK